MKNLLNAIITAIETPLGELRAEYASRNRANNMGEALENYIKDLFAGTVNEMDNTIRQNKLSETFSYLGNQNNPPDAIIRGSDAIEIKKIENVTSDIALNSSYPKAKLYADSPMITAACRNCEAWESKDLLYAVGVVNENHLSRLYFVYGVDYISNDDSVYDNFHTNVINPLSDTLNEHFDENGILESYQKIDAVGNTMLKVRCEIIIKSPARAFSHMYVEDKTAKFELIAIINDEKYYSFPEKDRATIESYAKNKHNFIIQNTLINDPNNPALIKSAKLLTYRHFDDQGDL